MAVVRKTKQANEDLYQIWHYIAVENDNPQYTDGFINTLDLVINDLARSPRPETVKE